MACHLACNMRTMLCCMGSPARQCYLVCATAVPFEAVARTLLSKKALCCATYVCGTSTMEGRRAEVFPWLALAQVPYVTARQALPCKLALGRAQKRSAP